jgi:hypothetical protein
MGRIPLMLVLIDQLFEFVTPGLVPGIHVLSRTAGKTWMAGTSPAMTA